MGLACWIIRLTHPQNINVLLNVKGLCLWLVLSDWYPHYDHKLWIVRVKKWNIWCTQPKWVSSIKHLGSLLATGWAAQTQLLLFLRFRCLIRMPLDEISGMSFWEESPGSTQEMQERLYPSAGLGTRRCPLLEEQEKVAGEMEVDGCFLLLISI